MNKLNVTYTNLVEFEWDDIDWLQEASRDAFYGLLSSFGIDPADSYKLSGCVIGGSQTTMETTAGYISLNGEILKVDAHSINITIPAAKVAWRVEETDDPSGTELDSEDNTVECYKKRRGKLVEVSSYTGEMPYNASNLIQVIKSKMNTLSDWVEPTLNIGHTNDASDPVKYRINMDGNLEIKGKFSSIVGCSGTVFTLDSDYRPELQKTTLFYQGVTVKGIYIGTAGIVFLQGGSDFVQESGNEFNSVVIY